MATTLIHIGTLIFQGLLGLFMAYAAYSLYTWTPPALAKMREALHLPRWFWLLAGTVATIGAASLLIGLIVPAVAAFASLWLIAFFVVATLTHVLKNDMRNAPPAVVFLVLALLLAALNWGNLAPLLGFGV